MTAPGPSTFDGEPQVLRALSELEARMTLALNTGLSGVTQSIAALGEQFHKALLEQERRNASFADRERVHELANQIQRVSLESVKASRLDDALESLTARIDYVEDLVNRRSLGMAHSTIGYGVMFTIMLTSNVLVYVFAHLAGH